MSRRLAAELPDGLIGFMPEVRVRPERGIPLTESRSAPDGEMGAGMAWGDVRFCRNEVKPFAPDVAINQLIIGRWAILGPRSTCAALGF